MTDTAANFIARSTVKAEDLEHRKKINFNIGRYNAVVPQGKQQFAELNLARERAKNIKWRAIETLDQQLEEFESNFTKRGGRVIWADADARSVQDGPRVQIWVNGFPQVAPRLSPVPGRPLESVFRADVLLGRLRNELDVRQELNWPAIVEYMGHITVHDVQAGKPVFSGRCQVFSKRGPDLPTHAEMYANDGARLKVYLAEAVDDCVAQLQAKNSEFQALTQPHGTPN